MSIKQSRLINVILELVIGYSATTVVASAQAPTFYQDHAHGWHWYEMQELPVVTEALADKQEKNSNTSQVHQKKSAKEIISAYREELENRLADAWMHPTIEKIKAYQAMQKDMLDRSKNFSDVWMQSVFLNPELDNTISSPVNQKARHIQLDLQSKQVKQTITNLASEYGLFFFFSGSCGYCHAFAPIVKMFELQYGWQVLAISLDGGALAEFPNPQPDNGLFQQWQVNVMPALYAVNPNTGHVIPIALGMTSIDQIEIRIMSLMGQ